jgi:hypothetical protein
MRSFSTLSNQSTTASSINRLQNAFMYRKNRYTENEAQQVRSRLLSKLGSKLLLAIGLCTVDQYECGKEIFRTLSMLD